MIDLNDPRTEKIADVISNKTSKKILTLLADNELSESEIAKGIGAPMNTVGYNIKKLEGAGLIEKVKVFLWSVKGKRIHKYKIANKKIIISPRNIIRGVIPTILITGALALGIKIFVDNRVSRGLTENTSQNLQVAQKVMDEGVGGIASELAKVSENFGTPTIEIINIAQNVWLWFLAGALSALLIFMVLNLWRRK